MEDKEGKSSENSYFIILAENGLVLDDQGAVSQQVLVSSQKKGSTGSERDVPSEFTIPKSDNVERSSDITKHPQCTLKQSYFLQTGLKRNIFSLAEQARLLDRDTDNKIFGSYLFNNIKENDHCFLMNKVVVYVMENLLFDGFIQDYAHIEDATAFFGTMERDLEGCTSENEEQVIKNVEAMENKIKMLGAEGKTKAIGELDLLFGYLRKCAFYMQRL
ncbi:uncharacterized protein LOC130367458 [Hyla sarda]|uniref:uncharacterized protein LOC130367458 n=1 Tax=Hyla sarda TaxID=327740 RepID=UPI0024C4299E|nr:uncharacterized protein LOC130367458 [Hyla sarda]